MVGIVRTLIAIFVFLLAEGVQSTGGESTQFDPAKHAFLIDDAGFFLPQMLESNDRKLAREKLNKIYARSDLSLGIARTTALFFESGSDTGWLFKYDSRSENLIVNDRAYALGFYDRGSEFAGAGMFRQACVDPSSPLFRFVDMQNDWAEPVLAAQRSLLTHLGSIKRVNAEEAVRATRIVGLGHPLPILLFSRDLSRRRAVLAISVEMHGFLASRMRPAVLLIYDPKSPYVRPDEKGDDGRSAIGTIKIAKDGTLSITLQGADAKVYPLILTDPLYEPKSTAFNEMANDALGKYNEALNPD